MSSGYVLLEGTVMNAERVKPKKENLGGIALVPAELRTKSLLDKIQGMCGSHTLVGLSFVSGRAA
jgi:hypothetical protein